MRCISNDPPHLVNELIDQTTGCWNKLLLQQHFIPMDQEVIANIPICSRRQEDFWAWHYEKSGKFTVRSAYCMLIHNKVQRTNWLERNAGKSETRAIEKEWTNIWKVSVPSKVRVFLWRLARHSIPTGDVRHHRNMATSSGCSICGAQDSWRHSLLDCHMSRCVWALEHEELTEYMCQIQNMDAKGWLAEVMEVTTGEEFLRIAMTLWAIWHARRKAIHESIFQSPLSTHCFVKRFLEDLELIRPMSVGKQTTTTWIP